MPADLMALIKDKLTKIKKGTNPKGKFYKTAKKNKKNSKSKNSAKVPKFPAAAIGGLK